MAEGQKDKKIVCGRRAAVTHADPSLTSTFSVARTRDPFGSNLPPPARSFIIIERGGKKKSRRTSSVSIPFLLLFHFVARAPFFWLPYFLTSIQLPYTNGFCRGAPPPPLIFYLRLLPEEWTKINFGPKNNSAQPFVS